MLEISDSLAIPDEEIVLSAVRAQGKGGQHVNKTSSAVHLRFDVRGSSLPLQIKERLLATSDRRISDNGVVVIKAQQHRSQEQNRAEALARLRELVLAATRVRRSRKLTQPTRASRQRRVESKLRRSRLKALRAKPQE